MQVMTYDQRGMLQWVFSQLSAKIFSMQTAKVDRNEKHIYSKCLHGKFCLWKSAFYVNKNSLKYIHKWDHDSFPFLLIGSCLR